MRRTARTAARPAALAFALALGLASPEASAQRSESTSVSVTDGKTYAPDVPELGGLPPASARPSLILGGALVTGAFYGLSLLDPVFWSDAPGGPSMRVPVAGPWIALADTGCPPADPDCGASKYLQGGYRIAMGLAQAGGLWILAEGLFLRTQPPAPSARRAPRPRVVAAPLVTPKGAGATLSGVF